MEKEIKNIVKTLISFVRSLYNNISIGLFNTYYYKQLCWIRPDQWDITLDIYDQAEQAILNISGFEVFRFLNSWFGLD